MISTIVPHPTWSIKDSSKLDEYLTCPRKYFFAHILGWKPDVPAHDLHFGSAWHKGREFQLIHGYDDIFGAYNAFLSEYRKYFDEETDAIYTPKSPLAALAGYMKFADERPRDLVDNEVVEIDGIKMTEISGTVPIADDRILHYKMDSIMHRFEGDKIFSWDHKTTKEKYLNGAQWADQFPLSIQNGTYTHCLFCIFPIEQVLGVEFCGVGFEHLTRGSKARPAGYYASFRRVPAFKTPDQMNVWLWTVNQLIDEIDRDMTRLDQCLESDSVMAAFRQNPKSCTAYKGCPYHEYCIAWPNPLQRCDTPPLGFRTEFWDPSAIESTVKKDLDFPFEA